MKMLLCLCRSTACALIMSATFLAQHYIKYELGDLADDQKSRTTVERYLQILNNRLIPRWGKPLRWRFSRWM